jgi:hypothetical protein
MAELARTFTVPALNVLADLMYHAESESVRMHAANLLLERAWGKAPQALQIRTQPEAERKRYTAHDQALRERGEGRAWQDCTGAKHSGEIPQSEGRASTRWRRLSSPPRMPRAACLNHPCAAAPAAWRC